MIKKPWIKSKLTNLFKKAKPSAEVTEDPEDEDTPNTAESEG